MAVNWTKKRVLGLVDGRGEVLIPDIEAIPTDRGAYEVSLVDVSGRPVCLPRLLKPDTEGALYIGSAPQGLNRRIASIQGNGGHKDFTPKFLEVHNRIRRIHPKFQVGIRWITSQSSRLAEVEEADALNRYADYFGELPPFNRALPKAA